MLIITACSQSPDNANETAFWARLFSMAGNCSDYEYNYVIVVVKREAHELKLLYNYSVMSGHSKWSTIKHKKEATDSARGKLFSKLSRAISIAAKDNPDPESNYKLRVAIEAAKNANMPKSNIERAVSKASGGQSLVEVTYEGFGPEGIAVLVETATDNRNRTGQEIKGLFDRGGGQLTGPGAVSFNFEPKGLFVVHKNQNSDDQILSLIDLGAQDVEETEDSLEVYVDPKQLSAIKEKAQDKGFRVRSFELVQNPKTLKTVTGEKEAGKALTFLNNLEEHDDVQKVFATLDVPQETLDKIDAGK